LPHFSADFKRFLADFTVSETPGIERQVVGALGSIG
jgi:hypothetical protein